MKKGILAHGKSSCGACSAVVTPQNIGTSLLLQGQSKLNNSEKERIKLPVIFGTKGLWVFWSGKDLQGDLLKCCVKKQKVGPNIVGRGCKHTQV